MGTSGRRDVAVNRRRAVSSPGPRLLRRLRPARSAWRSVRRSLPTGRVPAAGNQHRAVPVYTHAASCSVRCSSRASCGSGSRALSGWFSRGSNRTWPLDGLRGRRVRCRLVRDRCRAPWLPARRRDADVELGHQRGRLSRSPRGIGTSPPPVAARPPSGGSGSRSRRGGGGLCRSHDRQQNRHDHHLVPGSPPPTTSVMAPCFLIEVSAPGRIHR
jgi:hypothetical protein